MKVCVTLTAPNPPPPFSSAGWGAGDIRGPFFAGAMLGDASSGSNIALRDAVRHVQKSEGKSDNLLLWLSFVYTDIGCDIFLALRLFCLAQLTLACIMFVVLPSPLSRNLGSVSVCCGAWVRIPMSLILAASLSSSSLL